MINKKICIVGLGYVGLPLAIKLANQKSCLLTGKKLERAVFGYDINNQRPYQNNYIYSQPATNNQGYYQQSPAFQSRNSASNAQLTLKSLESMRERGLISEENYLKKLRELGF